MFYTRCYVALIIMDKWKTYRSFDNWKNQNYNELMKEYEIGKKCGDSMRSTDDCSFDDFCIGKWQRL